MESSTRLFRGMGLSAAALDEAWREYRQLAARELRPESSRLPVAAPAVVAIEVGTAGHTAEAKAEPPRLSIVVLPFANLSGDPEQEYFVDGVTESLTTDLSRISGCFVIARNTAFTGCDPKWCNQAVRRSDLFGLLSLAAAARCRVRAFQ